MTQEYVKYDGIPSITACEIQKQIELQQWILDPTSIPYDKKDTGLIGRSAGVQVSKPKSTVQKLLEVQQMVLGSYDY